MSARHYRVIILGESLASRIAAILLARRGVRVLTCQNGTPPDSQWLFSSLHLEQFLENLGGRSCFVPPAPFQVLTARSRVEVNGPTPLEEELRREFPRAFASLVSLLERLARLGQALEKQLLDAPLLPLFGTVSRLRFSLGALRRRLPLGRSSRRLDELLEGITDPDASAFLRALFSGLSLLPASTLTQGEAALLWRASTRSRQVSSSGLETLLHHRYEQFHGENERLDRVDKITVQGRRATEVVLKNGSRCSADHILVGSGNALRLLPAGFDTGTAEPPLGFEADLFDPRLPPLLAPRVILDGAPPLRLSFRSGENRQSCRGEVCREGGPPPSFEALNERFGHLLPFADYRLTPSGEWSALAKSLPPLRPFSRAGRVQVGTNILLCQGSAILPALGSMGEVLLGFACATRLGRQLKVLS